MAVDVTALEQGIRWMFLFWLIVFPISVLLAVFVRRWIDTHWGRK